MIEEPITKMHIEDVFENEDIIRDEQVQLDEMTMAFDPGEFEDNITIEKTDNQQNYQTANETQNEDSKFTKSDREDLFEND